MYMKGTPGLWHKRKARCDASHASLPGGELNPNPNPANIFGVTLDTENKIRIKAPSAAYINMIYIFSETYSS